MYFFSKFLKGDIPIVQDSLIEYDAVQYYFFSNFMSSRYLFDIQILLRFKLKIEYLFSDSVSPLELMHYHQRMEEIEEERKKHEEEQEALRKNK